MSYFWLGVLVVALLGAVAGALAAFVVVKVKLRGLNAQPAAPQQAYPQQPQQFQQQYPPQQGFPQQPPQQGWGQPPYPPQ